jgi:glycosyltransferase involved in cell wall biosynthesis
MRIVSVSYNPKADQHDPNVWLEKLGFYIGTLEALSAHCEVISIDMISWEGEIERNGVRHIFLPNTTSFLKLNRFVKQLQPDIVLVQGFGFMLQVIHLGLIKHSRTKIILQHHAEKPITGLRRYVFRIAGRYTGAYFFATRSMAYQWTRERLISPDKVFPVPEASSVFFIKDAINKEKETFLWVGRLNANKDPLTVITAFSEYVKRHPLAKLYMICQPGDLLKDMKTLVEKNKASQNIFLSGKIERRKMLSFYERSSFIVSSSYYEGCNISVLEGMSCGCIPIVTRISSFDLHTDNGRIGLQFKAGDVKELLECLNNTGAMNIDEERKTVLQYFEKELSFRAIAGKIYSAATSLLK